MPVDLRNSRDARPQDAVVSGLLRPMTMNPDVPRKQVFALSVTERRLVSLATAGLRNREIAAELDLVEQTVKNMLSGVYRKCGVRNRTELARVMRDIGIGAA